MVTELTESNGFVYLQENLRIECIGIRNFNTKIHGIQIKKSFTLTI